MAKAIGITTKPSRASRGAAKEGNVKRTRCFPLSPLRGSLPSRLFGFPRLAPWATFFRRSAANTQKQEQSPPGKCPNSRDGLKPASSPPLHGVPRARFYFFFVAELATSRSDAQLTGAPELIR